MNRIIQAHTVGYFFVTWCSAIWNSKWSSHNPKWIISTSTSIFNDDFTLHSKCDYIVFFFLRQHWMRNMVTHVINSKLSIFPWMSFIYGNFSFRSIWIAPKQITNCIHTLPHKWNHEHTYFWMDKIHNKHRCYLCTKQSCVVWIRDASTKPKLCIITKTKEKIWGKQRIVSTRMW